MSENVTEIFEIQKRSTSTSSSTNIQEEPNSVTALKLFGGLDLISSIIVAIYIWAKYGFEGTYYITSNPIGIMIGIGVLLQGIFSCALFFVIAHIALNLIEINKNTRK